MTEQQTGELLTTVKYIGEGVATLNRKMETVLAFQASTEERLKNGNKKFEEHGVSIKQIEKDCVVKCAASPSKTTTYTLIVVGFTVIGALITIYKFLG